MALTSEKEHLDLIYNACLAIFDKGEPTDAMQICNDLMSIDTIPMHNPCHHFLIPAAMLTSANMICANAKEKQVSDLKKALERSKDIPGGICGSAGCCGAAVGIGIFSSVWRATTPMSKGDWASANRLTAAALMAIGSVEGPRCCKRNAFLSISAVKEQIKKEMGVDLGKTEIKCNFHDNNRECKRDECPFYNK